MVEKSCDCNISILHSKNPKNQSKQKEHFDTIYFQSYALFKCLIKLPYKYNPKNSYPLIVGLHGGGGSPDNFITIFEEINQPEFIYAVPYAPYYWIINGNEGYDWSLWPTADEKLMEQAAVLTENYIANLIEDLTKRYRVNTVYLLGYSQGSIFTYRAGIKNHHLFNGLICLSGPGLLEKLWSSFSGTLHTNWLPEKFIKAGNHLRIFITNGKKDRLTPFELGIKSRDVLMKYGYNVTFHTFDGGHAINKDILKLIIK